MSDDRPHWDREWLIENYWEDPSTTIEDVADRAGAGVNSVQDHLDRHGLRPHQVTGDEPFVVDAPGPDLEENKYDEERADDREFLIEQYWERGLSHRQIGEIIEGSDGRSIRGSFRRLDIPARTPNEARRLAEGHVDLDTLREQYDIE